MSNNYKDPLTSLWDYLNLLMWEWRRGGMEELSSCENEGGIQPQLQFAINNNLLCTTDIRQVSVMGRWCQLILIALCNSIVEHMCHKNPQLTKRSWGYGRSLTKGKSAVASCFQMWQKYMGHKNNMMKWTWMFYTYSVLNFSF